MSPVFRYAKPSADANERAKVLFPDPAGPSIATTSVEVERGPDPSCGSTFVISPSADLASVGRGFHVNRRLSGVAPNPGLRVDLERNLGANPNPSHVRTAERRPAVPYPCTAP